MAAGMSQVHRIIWGHGVEWGIYRHPVYRWKVLGQPLILMPAAPKNPRARFSAVGRCGHLTHDFAERRCLGQVKNLLSTAEAKKMAVSFYEARNNSTAL